MWIAQPRPMETMAYIANPQVQSELLSLEEAARASLTKPTIGIRNALSFDIEDWFCVANFEKQCPQSKWSEYEIRSVAPTLRLLDLLDRKNTRATFFVLGWLAERCPEVVQEIANRGHEVASHGYNHQRLTSMTRDEFASDLDKSLEVLRQATGITPLGYRAPSFSVTEKTLWAIDVLHSRGLAYDSSVFPTGAHPDYGIGDAPLEKFQWVNGLWEIPMSCAEVGNRRIPCGGGGYFRLFPYQVSKHLLQSINRSGRPFIFYLHPWELDPKQPRVNAPLLKRFRHYVNLDRTWNRLERLIDDFDFTTMESMIPRRKEVVEVL